MNYLQKTTIENKKIFIFIYLPTTTLSTKNGTGMNKYL